MTRSGEKMLKRALWTLFAFLAAAGWATLAEALFARRPIQTLAVPDLAVLQEVQDAQVDATGGGLVERRFTRLVVKPTQLVSSSKPVGVPLDSLIKLTGLLDFGGIKPTLAVIEAIGESKSYRAGDHVGETGVVIKDIRDYVIVEFQGKRFKMTFAAIQELPANTVGKE